ncbi:SPOR domain-containing protein [Thiobacter aerophilum]|uniref:SPOR domain-containing protein n=1 Tax=Thiobacter aerophilum TaxID=3121275 RepID=A0ABV0EDJ7_9BURK
MNKDYKPRSAPRSGAGNPMLTGILIGIFIGLGAAIAVAWYVPSLTRGFRQPEAPPAAKPEPAKPPAEAQTKADADNRKPRFDFYNILPGTEEPVTDQEGKQPVPGTQEQLFLQAGAFQNQSDADNLKARLALMGVEATVQSTELPDKGVWHRVRIGPFTSLDEMSQVRATLAQNGIQATLVKVKEAVAR